MNTIEVDLTPAQIKAIRGGRSSVRLSEEQAASVRGTLNGLQGGRPKVADRCACGLMTRSRAEARGHICR
jgi:hypothetical protein